MSDEKAPADLVEYITTLLENRLGSRVRNLRVRVEDGGLILEGQASTYHTKQLAQHWAMEESSLPIFANKIEVR
ncbi:MAG: hypothetical protein HYX68_14910 [Planctomycetes bacterium]|nr:hypothetical protein [Planctomycetota bacterium]